MSLSSVQARVQYTVTTSPQTFAVPFYILSSSDITVVKTVAGVDTTLVLNTDYTVTGAATNPSTTSVVGITGLTGATLTIYRNAALTQPSTYVSNDRFPASTQEQNMDRLTMMAQQQAEQVKRSIRTPVSNAEIDPLSLTFRRSALLGFDSAGAPAMTTTQAIIDAAVAAAGAFASGTVIEVGTIAALKAVSVTALVTNRQARVLGYYNAGDGGGGTFYYSSGSSATDNGGTIIQPTTGSGRWLRSVGTAITPEMFGMKGDGSTDDFPAWIKLVAYINTALGGVITFGINKTYFFGQHIVLGNGVTNPIFRSLTGLVIEGNGSAIKVQGGFNRAVITTTSLGGLVFYACSKVTIRNLELNGNNATITKGGGIAESPYSYGLLIGSSFDFSLENVYSHHWCTDGFAVTLDDSAGNPFLSCRRVRMANCRSTYNGRQGISIIQVRGFIATDCEFSYTGTSSYGFHSPAAGIDVEPGRSTASAPPDNMDINCGEITFQNCRIVGNNGSIIGCAYPLVTDNVRLIDCYGECDEAQGGDGNAGLIFMPTKGVIRGGYYDMRNRGFYPVFGSTASDVIMEGVTVKGWEELCRALSNAPLVVKDCRFISTKTDPTQDAPTIYIANTLCRFVNNYIFIPKECWADGGAGRCLMVRLDTVSISENNIYETDLATVAEYFYISYATGNIRHERLIGQIPGTADTFRPGINSFDSRQLYAQNNSSADLLNLGTSENGRRITTASAAPVSGAWTRGDIVFNNSTAAGGSFGWACTTGGTPGTWKALPNVAA